MPSDLKRVTIYLSAAELAALKRQAASQGVTLAGLLRRAVGLEPLPVGKGRLRST